MAAPTATIVTLTMPTTNTNAADGYTGYALVVGAVDVARAEEAVEADVEAEAGPDNWSANKHVCDQHNRGQQRQ